MAVFAYSRVNTKEQSTENQRLEIERAGDQIDYWFSDEAISGKTSASQRPKFKELLTQIRKGESIVVSKLDRLGRDAIDVATTIKSLAARDIEVIVLRLGKLDLTSPAGKLMLAMLGAVAKMERDLLVERTQAGLARANAKGKKLGRPNKTNEKQRTEIINRPTTGESVSALAIAYNVSRASIIRVINSNKTSI
jgi:putative DNA-invertase from lambdoid prophage Rac